MTHLTVSLGLRLRWITLLAEGIAYMHSKDVVWCDCKLPSVLVTADLDVMLCDFGGSSSDGCPASIGPPIFYMLPSQLDNPTWRFPPNQDKVAFSTSIFLLLARRWPLRSKFLEEHSTWEEMQQVEHKYRQGGFDALSPEAYPELAQVAQKCWRDEYTSTEDMLRDVCKGCAATLKEYEQRARAQLYGDISPWTVQQAPKGLRGSGRLFLSDTETTNVKVATGESPCRSRYPRRMTQLSRPLSGRFELRVATMVNFTILAGGYATFVASYLFDTDASSLTLLNQSPTGSNPSWITLHPTNSSILYAVNENSAGELQSYTVGPQGALTGPVGQTSSGGDSPAFTVALKTGQVAIMNYNSGNGFILPTTPDPLHFGSASLITFPASVSHPHMVLEHGNEVLVPDLGADKIWRLTEDGSPGKWAIRGEIPQPSGSGPRHIAIFEDTLYTLHELASTVTAQHMPAAPNGTSTILTQLSTVPPNNLTGATWQAGEILIPAPNVKFPTPYVYASNRNTGSTIDPRGDTVAIFATRPELKLVAQVYTGLDQIRGMEFGGENDEYLVASGVVGSGGVVVFRRTEGGTGLVEVARNTQIPNRTSFLWGSW
ncbi:hypothetical protein EW146_g3915 [Bondarzewia mesenterica]|uniref:Protein kinase domain-containing protein n=1 Tax=Bondarzewia mesenterica TaxID=1095465 RepID=A0A4S4LYB1_9AGAM|nr:hypothetical protein EW146_g3915 [Bondarzewia mesenterica]